MNHIPIVFAFDNNLSMPAAICIFSLLYNAKATTFYDIFILHSPTEKLNTDPIERVVSRYENAAITYKTVSDEFEKSFIIRGISCTTYYRLLIPDLIKGYEKVIYSDVDVIFRGDLSDIYNSFLFGENLIAGVKSLYHLIPENKTHYSSLGIDPQKTIYAGNIILNVIAMQQEQTTAIFKKMAKEKFKFQDMDIINVVCKDRIGYLGPEFCLSTYISDAMVRNREAIKEIWNDEELDKASKRGIVHYNGQKPWKGYCLNFDIWWEYYRKSPIFDENFYFKFYYNRLEELDTLPLMKRVKSLVRYFVYGRKKLI